MLKFFIFWTEIYYMFDLHSSLLLSSFSSSKWGLCWVGSVFLCLHSHPQKCSFIVSAATSRQKNPKCLSLVLSSAYILIRPRRDESLVASWSAACLKINHSVLHKLNPPDFSYSVDSAIIILVTLKSPKFCRSYRYLFCFDFSFVFLPLLFTWTLLLNVVLQ